MKSRPPIPDEIVNQLMFMSGHRCCLDHEEFSNSPLDIHHLDENPKNNEINNLLPVCKNCHHGKIHNIASFARKYSSDELKSNRDDWYKRIDEQRKEKAKLAVNEDDLRIETEFSVQDKLTFKVFFQDSEILLGKNTNIIFNVENRTNFKIKFLNYQFHVFYIFTNKLIHHVSFLKHIWNFQPSELESSKSLRKEFNKVDPMKYYLMSDQKGQWIVRVVAEFQIEDGVTINSVYSDAKIKIV